MVSSRRREGGQTIVIAMIVLGVLLILGFVFLGIVNGNLQGSNRQQARTREHDYAEDGVRYAFAQLVNSELGADWRGNPTGPISLNPNVAAPDSEKNFTGDPDANYLRLPDLQDNDKPMSSTNLPKWNVGAHIDLGGPDGFGPFVRVNYNTGRALVRVRYQPSDINMFSTSPSGSLRDPGSIRSYLIIESIGRTGRVNPRDPTTMATKATARFRNFASPNDFLAGLQTFQKAEANFAHYTKLTAFASIGLTDTARFITDKYRVSRAADIGIPDELGASAVALDNAGNAITASSGGQSSFYSGTYLTTTVNLLGTTLTGSAAPAAISPLTAYIGTDDIGATPVQSAGKISGFGSIYCNSPLVIHGNVTAGLNLSLGDQIDVADAITYASLKTSSLKIISETLNANKSGWVQTATILSGQSLESHDPAFNTAGGAVRDGIASTDLAGYPRGVGYKTPPSIETPDPDTGLNRYVQMTAQSGFLVSGFNSGQAGHGRGVYVDNFSDQQIPTDEAGRQNIGAEKSLVYDWLNPNNANGGAWVGPFYVPVGAQVLLTTDGFTITRDQRSGDPAQMSWRDLDGSTNQTLSGPTNQYKVGLGSDGVLKIVDKFSKFNAGTSIGSRLSPTDFDSGLPFNGVLYFEGNVRVRGVIPTDVQLTLVSNASIYIEGSITKGQYTVDTAGATQWLTRPSRSFLGLFAREYVTLNTTQFFGTGSGTVPNPKNDVPVASQYNPITMQDGDTLVFKSEFVLDPNANPGNGALIPTNPSTWLSYPLEYQDALTPANKIDTDLVLTHSMDQGNASATFMGFNVNELGFASADARYQFLASPLNGATPFNFTPLYVFGLGTQGHQAYPEYESDAFPIVDSGVNNASTLSADRSTITWNNWTVPNYTPVNGFTGFDLFATGSNDFTFRAKSNITGVPSNNYLLARASLMPHDIRIEAAIYAEEGSFFVIPGNWFNSDPNDRRDIYEARVAFLTQSVGAQNAQDTANIERQQNFGSSVATPFYGEPTDVHIVISGSVAENMPQPMSVQAEWLKKWGWIPGRLAATGGMIPIQHVPTNLGLTNLTFVPNLIIQHDPSLATGRLNGFANFPLQGQIDNSIVRTDNFLRPLPPLPRLPVSPALAFFGEVE